MSRTDFTALEAALGYSFQRPELLERALTHSSHAHEESKSAGENTGTEKQDNEHRAFGEEGAEGNGGEHDHAS